MNEQRIREIANQASDHAENTVEYFPDTEDGLDYPAKMMKVRDLKFAELIVRECLAHGKLTQSQAVVNGSEEYNAGREMGIEVFMNQIKKHFGVKE